MPIYPSWAPTLVYLPISKIVFLIEPLENDDCTEMKPSINNIHCGVGTPSKHQLPEIYTHNLWRKDVLHMNWCCHVAHWSYISIINEHSYFSILCNTYLSPPKLYRHHNTYPALQGFSLESSALSTNQKRKTQQYQCEHGTHPAKFLSSTVHSVLHQISITCKFIITIFFILKYGDMKLPAQSVLHLQVFGMEYTQLVDSEIRLKFWVTLSELKMNIPVLLKINKI